MKTIQWEISDLGGGQDTIVAKAARKMLQSDQVITKWAPALLQMTLDELLWKDSDRKELIIPLDVHVYNQASELGLTKRKPKDIVTAREITDALREVFPDDPLLGDFALFGYGVTSARFKESE